MTTSLRIPDKKLARSMSPFWITPALTAFGLFLLPSYLPGQSPSSTTGVAALHSHFMTPPDDSRIMMRWWWFGPAATKPELTRELEQMKAAGIGGVEIANLYPLALDDPSTGFHNTPYLSPEHLEALRFAAEEARRLGLRVDVTLGSGWPFGGPEIPVTDAAGKLRVEELAVTPGSTSVQAPYVDAGEEIIAAFLVAGKATTEDLAGAEQLAPPSSGWYKIPAASGARTIFCFLSSRTGMMVKRPSVGAAGFVLDHYDRTATETHLHAVGDRLLSAFGDQPPYAVFSDSLEDYASDWSPALLAEFQRRRGYDLRPHLLALLMDAGPETAAIRHDWGRTLTEMADDNFLAPIHAWAQEHHTLLRSQTYGFPPVTLFSNRLADLPEGEGKATFQMWREFSDTRWAASAGHLFHHSVVSSETWTWLHSPAFRATPLDMKAEADLHFLQGINQLVGHGWPYSPASAGEPGWRMYAAAALNAHNPWYAAMPDLTRYLQRVSFTLRQGQPVNDVALLLPNDDVWAGFSAGVHKRATPTSPAGFDESGSNVTVDESMDKFLGKKVIAQVLDAGFNLDFIDADTINNTGLQYKVLILPAVDRLPVATYEKILDFAQHGGIVIATRRLPATAPGFLRAQEDSARLKELSQTLFHGNIASAHFVEDESALGSELARDIASDMTLYPRTPEIGFLHRKLAEGELYFVANTSNETKHVQAHFRETARHAETWDAFSGEVFGIADPQKIDLELAPYESRLIFFSDSAMTGTPKTRQQESLIADLSQKWDVSFGSTGISKEMDRLTSWTEDTRTQFYSGLATYTRSFALSKNAPRRAGRLFLDFGTGNPEPPPSPPGQHNMRAYLQSPIREAAQVYLNGKLAGVVWHPPYRVDVTDYAHGGANELRIVVGNTAINSLAGQPLPDYRLLWDRYGMLFVPQDMQNLKPLPSGMLGPVKLLESKPVE
ncbi:glycosyl hydrolase [Acidicapsa acidisoli]|uniref:glycosyl hydrolase n=1 Tax=Acidicapsa acidisoli TaxID=1615681 RepID=UPI0021E00390|nr:glycosyl hydrolase [Acidicapsa acidisoli]